MHDPADRVLFPTFAPEVVEDMKRWGTVEEVPAGGVLFAEGETDYDLFVVLEGRIRVTKRIGGDEQLLTVHEAGGIAGEIGILSGAPAIATGTAVEPARVLRIPVDAFRQMIAQSTPFSRAALQALSGRTRDVDAQMRQQEKLTALGRMAAGLAHELNNPAAAARRAAAALRDEMAAAQRRSLDHDCRLDPAQRDAVRAVYARLASAPAPKPADALARSDAEDAVALWLDERGMEDAWECAPSLVDAGLDAAGLQALDATFAGDALEAAVEWLAGTLLMTTLAGELEGSAGKISTLVKAIKEYSYMDRGRLQRLDVHDGLESTLAMLGHKLRSGITVHREYDRTLPQICASGSELNQVWTNLVDNAAAAMNGRGNLWIRTMREGLDSVRIEIADDGPGIPPAVQPRIWEPFFTTKGVGEGTGLGLDIARRIVERGHGGVIRAVSHPGDTRFIVTLRIDGPPRTGA
ncbi:MAG TPA: ATP-binding protein [Longimicrobium sp.]|nr:ATP-binding protein [Longimicrobium sp.]